MTKMNLAAEKKTWGHTAVAWPLKRIPAWEFGLARFLYGLATKYRLHTKD